MGTAKKNAVVRKRKKVTATAKPSSVAKQVYEQVKNLNFDVQYKENKNSQEVNLFPLNDRSERITFKQVVIDGTQTEFELAAVRGGETFHCLSVIVLTGSKTEAAVLAVVKSELKRLC